MGETDRKERHLRYLTPCGDHGRVQGRLCLTSIELDILGDRSGEYCVCKLIAPMHIGTIHTQFITKPANRPYKLRHLQDRQIS